MVASTMIPAVGPVDRFFTGTPPRAMNASMLDHLESPEG
jgi:hypothetical protein